MSLDTARTKVSDVRDHEMLFYSTDTTTDEDENYIKRKERKRRRSHGLAGNASSKKCRMGSEGKVYQSFVHMTVLLLLFHSFICTHFKLSRLSFQYLVFDIIEVQLHE